jgi:hypothetical protein
MYMLPFNKFLVEYAKKENIFTRQLTGIKHGRNGKSFDRVQDRKHGNTVNKQYNHKDPLISSIVRGKANNVQLSGNRLIRALSLYDVDFEPNKIKTLGNSGVKIKMYVDQAGNKRGILTRKGKV